MTTFQRSRPSSRKTLLTHSCRLVHGGLISLQFQAGAYAFQNRHKVSKTGSSKSPVLYERISVYCFHNRVIENGSIRSGFVSI